MTHGLSATDIARFARLPCWFCGVPSMSAPTGTPVPGVSLVEIQPGRGWRVGNVLPACAECARMKGTLSVAEFQQQIERVYRELHGLRHELVREEVSRGVWDVA